MTGLGPVAGLTMLLLCWAASPAAAQPQEAPANAPALAADQKLLIYQSVSATQKNNAAPTGFRPAVGAEVPPGIDLQPMPAAVIGVIPTVKGMNVAMIEKQVVIVDASSRTVLAVVTHGE